MSLKYSCEILMFCALICVLMASFQILLQYYSLVVYYISQDDWCGGTMVITMFVSYSIIKKERINGIVVK